MVNLCDSPVFKNVVKVITYFKKPGLVTNNMHRSRPPRLGGGMEVVGVGGWVSGGGLILIAKVGVGIGGVVPIPLFGNVN